MVAGSRVLVFLPIVASIACGYPSYGFVPDDAPAVEPKIDSGTLDVDPIDTFDSAVVFDEGLDALDAADSALVIDSGTDTLDAAETSKPCTILVGGDACKKIPRFPAGVKQVVDGAGDEFCEVVATKTIASSGAFMEPTPPPAGIDTVFYTRVAWSDDALHIHVRVEQSAVYPPSSIEQIWHGDAVEIFVGGTAPLTGKYGPKTGDADAYQVIGAPAGSAAARAEVWYDSALQAFLPPSSFAARIVPGGYEIELLLDWTTLKMKPVSGAVIAFDSAVDVRRDSSVTGPRLQSFLGYTKVIGPSPCNPERTTAHPSCDDRSWCSPSLE